MTHRKPLYTYKAPPCDRPTIPVMAAVQPSTKRDHKADMGNALADLLRATERYCLAYEAVHGQPVGHDGVLGDLGISQILAGAHTLLNGELGTKDGGELSEYIWRLQTRHDLEE